MNFLFSDGLRKNKSENANEILWRIQQKISLLLIFLNWFYHEVKQNLFESKYVFNKNRNRVSLIIFSPEPKICQNLILATFSSIRILVYKSHLPTFFVRIISFEFIFAPAPLSFQLEDSFSSFFFQEGDSSF